MTIKKQFLLIFSTSIITLGLFFGIQYLFAWANPTVNPPSGNVSPAINESSTAQVKNGSLGISGNLAAPIFYDANNTGYYVDPAGTSRFNSINLGGENRNSWPAGCTAFTADSNQCGGNWCGRYNIDQDADYFCHSKGYNFAIRYTTKVVSGGYFWSYTGVWPTYSGTWTSAHYCSDCTVLDIVVCC